MDEHEDAHSLPEAIALTALLNAKKLPKRTKVALTYDAYLPFANAIVERLKLSGWRFEKQQRDPNDFTPPTHGPPA